jgi:hypothetical protein
VHTKVFYLIRFFYDACSLSTFAMHDPSSFTPTPWSDLHYLRFAEIEL